LQSKKSAKSSAVKGNSSRPQQHATPAEQTRTSPPMSTKDQRAQRNHTAAVGRRCPPIQTLQNERAQHVQQANTKTHPATGTLRAMNKHPAALANVQAIQPHRKRRALLVRLESTKMLRRTRKRLAKRNLFAQPTKKSLHIQQRQSRPARRVQLSRSKCNHRTRRLIVSPNVVQTSTAALEVTAQPSPSVASVRRYRQTRPFRNELAHRARLVHIKILRDIDQCPAPHNPLVPKVSTFHSRKRQRPKSKRAKHVRRTPTNRKQNSLAVRALLKQPAWPACMPRQLQKLNCKRVSNVQLGHTKLQHPTEMKCVRSSLREDALRVSI